MATRKPAAPAKKATQKPAAKTTSRRRTRLPDDEDGLLEAAMAGDDEGGEEDGETDDMDGVSTGGQGRGRQRAAAELAAALSFKKNGEPAFSYPPELPAEHKPYWLEVVNSRPLNYFNAGDITLLKMYCRAAYDSERLSKEIDREGEVIRNQKGNPVVNPKVLVRSINESRVMSLSAKLRVQPSARYDSGNDKKQAEKTRNAEGAARTIDEDGDDLLAGKNGRTMLN